MLGFILFLFVFMKGERPEGVSLYARHVCPAQLSVTADGECPAFVAATLSATASLSV